MPSSPSLSTCYITAVTPPVIAAAPLAAAHLRIRKSFELIAGSAASPQTIRDAAWTQATLPTAAAGLDLGHTPADAGWVASVLHCWPTVVAHTPALATTTDDALSLVAAADNATAEAAAATAAATAAVRDRTTAAAAITAATAAAAAAATEVASADAAVSSSYLATAIATYNTQRAALRTVAATHAAFDRTKYFTVRGGYMTRFRPRRLPLPTAEAVPPPDEVLDSASKSKAPSSGSLAAIEHHAKWLRLHDDLYAVDMANALRTSPSTADGSSATRHREASRLISASLPFADGWLKAEPDGSAATTIATAEFRVGLQRRLGLWLSAFVDAVAALVDRGTPADYLGDYADGRANHKRRHDDPLRCWYNAVSAVAECPIVLGDKERPELTKHLNEGHVVDMAELNDAPDGTSRLNELKVYSALSKHYDGGCGSTLNGGAPTSVGHLYGCGNTEEPLRLGNLGCAERGHPDDAANDANTRA